MSGCRAIGCRPTGGGDVDGHWMGRKSDSVIRLARQDGKRECCGLNWVVGVVFQLASNAGGSRGRCS